VVGIFNTVEEVTPVVSERAEREERYRSLFESIDEGFCTFDMIFDDAGVPVDYRFVEYNPAFERHTGLTGALGRTVREIVPDQDREWFEIYGRVAMTGEPVRVVRYGQALRRWFEIYAFRIGEPDQRRVAALFSNVTARKEADCPCAPARSA
jgi:PAS domain S-box-containing protein